MNIVALLIGGLLMTGLYLMSVRPAALARKIGPKAYKRSGLYRMLTSITMLTITANYIIYHWHPVPFDPFPVTFRWPYWISVVIAVAIAIPSLYLEIRSIRDAKAETLLPQESHTLYGGIYERIRHPMALGELPLWWVLAFLVHSPFLVVLSFIWIPIWFWWCVAEERDLLLRYGETYAAYRERTGMFFPRW
ncbi:MAG: isoprenylcysteine carboxylmethyltransferase family protein [Dactylosporangium sp.]|nr:isoprenylcysteine carboxylmethyltransferase family protein [Dactylosporangium sp.]